MIEPQVAFLANELTSRGFGWLATELMTAIEASEMNLGGRDFEVTEQRKDLERRIIEGTTTQTLPLDELRQVSIEGSETPTRLDGAAQIRFAVDFVVKRLAGISNMAVAVSSELEALMNSRVDLRFIVSGEPRPIDREVLQQVADAFISQRQQICDWLIGLKLGRQ